MKVLVCGSRTFQDYKLLKETLDGIDCTEIIHGGARGADSLAETYARDTGKTVHRFPALWDLHGKSAGHIRNQQMLQEGQPDMVIAFWDGVSRGTKNMIEISEKAGIPTKIVKIGGVDQL